MWNMIVCLHATRSFFKRYEGLFMFQGRSMLRLYLCKQTLHNPNVLSWRFALSSFKYDPVTPTKWKTSRIVVLDNKNGINCKMQNTAEFAKKRVLNGQKRKQ